MVDFKKRLAAKINERIVEPWLLYNTLDRKSVAGPLRPVQEHILKEWYSSHYDDKDTIIKLHTGEGKTLIGLLILQSMINSNRGPCLYICPNIYLLKQVCADADKFGIPYCVIKDDNSIPDEFSSGEKILITNAHKVFNGKTIFGLDNSYVKVGAVVLDDSHACIDVIRDSQTIVIKKNDNALLYERMLTLFADDLCDQGEGSFLDVKEGKYDTFMLVPYWSWYDKKSEVLRLLSDEQGCNAIQFVWPLMRDRIDDYMCFVSGTEIEIVPYNASADFFYSFSRANHRILMSATTQDDAFFIKGLSFSAKAVKNPLVYKDQKWSGEKMIIIPSQIRDECDRDLVVTWIAKLTFDKCGVVSLVPSTKIAEQYSKLGAICADKNTIESILDNLKKGNFGKTIVINNRYDGIDLPDECCRILVIDSMPYFNSMLDRYEKKSRPDSEIINKKIAQRIEQGLGRGVRGEKDYCAILIIGSELVKFMRSMSTKKFFSLQTQKQIEIGLEIAKLANEDVSQDENSLNLVISLINQMLNRDEGWKEYYTDAMNRIESVSIEGGIYDKLAEEAKIESDYRNGEVEKAVDEMQSYIDRNITDENEKGWYLQQIARYLYPIRKEESIEKQQAAFKKNSHLLKPIVGIKYSKVSFVHENRMNKIHSFIKKYESYNELLLAVNALMGNLSFGMDSDKFEQALKDLGELLGFVSQRPDKEIRKGPDNLWCGTKDEFCLFECKDEVSENRNSISKTEAGQMNNHCAWFKEEYGDEAIVHRFMVIPTKNLSYEADLLYEVRVIRRGKLKTLKEAIKAFIHSLAKYEMNDLSDEKIQELVNLHKLNMEDFVNEYSEQIYHETK